MEDRASILIRLFEGDKLITDFSNKEVTLSILSKPDGRVVFQAGSNSGLIFCEESYIYAEFSASQLETLKPYDLKVELRSINTSDVRVKVLHSFVTLKPESCNEFKGYAKFRGAPNLSFDAKVRIGRILRGWDSYEGFKYFHPESTITKQEYYELATFFQSGAGKGSAVRANEQFPNEATGEYALAVGGSNKSFGKFSFAEGRENVAGGNSSHAEGFQNSALGNNSHAEGASNSAEGACSHVEGIRGVAYGNNSHVEGDGSVASGDMSHAEGVQTRATGRSSHAEGQRSTASGNVSHAEGNNTVAEGQFSHAEGQGTKALGKASHTEGSATIAEGAYSHAGGQDSVAKGVSSFVHGTGLTANNKNESVFGKNNIPDILGNSVFQIGTGTASNPQTAFQVNENGDIEILYESRRQILSELIKNALSNSVYFLDFYKEDLADIVNGKKTSISFNEEALIEAIKAGKIIAMPPYPAGEYYDSYGYDILLYAHSSDLTYFAVHYDVNTDYYITIWNSDTINKDSIKVRNSNQSVDAAISDTSKNPVQNKVVKEYVDNAISEAMNSLLEQIQK